MFGLEPLTPAYGRDYKSLKAIQTDFDCNKDFKTAGGQYINKPQIVELGITRIRCRFGNLLRTDFLEVK